MAGRCIAADPYAVLRYGDAETLSLEAARELLDGLKKLSKEDPYFRSEDWGRHRVSGLMRPELKEEIVGIISTSEQHVQLRTLLLEAMAGAVLASELVEVLDEIMVDPDRCYDERAAAADAIRSANEHDDWEAIVIRLLKLGDEDSARLACEFIDDVGAGAVSISTSVETVFAHLGLSVSRFPQSDEESIWNMRRSLFSDLDGNQLCILLDEIADGVQVLTHVADDAARAEVANLVVRLTAIVLEAEQAIEPKRIWAWIGWFDREMVQGDEARERLAEIFRRSRALRTALLEHVLLTPCAKSAFSAGHRLIGTGLDLYPTDEDVAGLLKALRARAGDGAIDPEMWRGLLYLDRNRDGISAVVHDAAREAAREDSELFAVLADVEKVVEAPWEKEEAERKARAEEERRELFDSRCAALAERMDDIVAGDFRVLVESAAVYMGRVGRFDRDGLPQLRLREFLGVALCDQVLGAFVTVLSRDDLPSAAEIVKARCEKKWWPAELPMICELAEMIRRNVPVDKVDGETLSAVYMAWQRNPVSRLAEIVDMDAALEAVLFKNEADKESHFRASIEPQLACNIEHTAELSRLVNEPRFGELAGRLCIEWLEAFPALSARTQRELLVCALRDGSRDAVKALLGKCGTSVESEDETRRLWLSANFMIDFDKCSGALYAAAARDPELLWTLRDRVGLKRKERGARLSLPQQVFIAKAFGKSWSEVGWPADGTIGSKNPSDASDIIRRIVIMIGGDPSPDATEELKRLIEEGHAPSYVNTMRHVLALQLRVRRDREYTTASVSQLEAIVADGPPETVDDMRAYFVDLIEVLQEQMHGSNTDMWQTFWSEERPRDELYCRESAHRSFSRAVAAVDSVRAGDADARAKASGYFRNPQCNRTSRRDQGPVACRCLGCGL